MENYKLPIVIDCSASVQKDIVLKLKNTNVMVIGYDQLQENTTIIKEIVNISDIKQLEKQKDENPNIQVICVVENGDIMFQAIALQPLQFIRKQELAKDLEQTISIIQDKLRGLDTYYTFKSGDSTIRLDTRNIIYMESHLHYVTLHTKNGDFQIRQKISSLYQQLSDLGFIRIHKSYVINSIFILKATASTISLTNKIELPVGRVYKENIKML